MSEGFYENFPKSGTTNAPDIAIKDLKESDILSDGIKKYVHKDAVAHKDAILHRDAGWYDAANALLNISGKTLYKKNGGTSTDIVTVEANAATEVKTHGHVNSRVYTFPVMQTGNSVPVAHIKVNAPEFGTKKPSTAPATPTISANIVATVSEKTPFVALQPSDAPHVQTIHAQEDVPSDSAQSAITPIAGQYDVWKVDGLQITKRDGTHPQTKVFYGKDGIGRKNAIAYIVQFADILKQPTTDFFVDQGNGHDHEHVFNTKEDILKLLPTLVDGITILSNKYIKEVDVKVDRTEATEKHYEIKEK